MPKALANMEVHHVQKKKRRNVNRDPKANRKRINVSILAYSGVIFLSVTAALVGYGFVRYVDLQPTPAYADLICKETTVRDLEALDHGRFGGQYYVLTDLDGICYNIAGKIAPQP